MASEPRPANRARHRPVLLRETLRWLDLAPGLTVVDGTVGAGGHSSQILGKIRPGGRLIGLDRDPMMLAHAENAFAANGLDGPDADLVQSSYADLRAVLDDRGIGRVDRALLDLGLSSDQLADEGRGFGFQADGPLDLRFDVSRGRPAASIVNGDSAAELARILREYGEEPHADRIAERIVRGRPVRTARQLAELVSEAAGSGRSATHPATRVFQALRIAANRELEELRRMLAETLPTCLAAGGTAVVISFHSLEDRLAKEAFRDRVRWEELTPKPVVATPSEQRLNPRSRSAKLRAARLR